ncbi:hypothetical protein L249_0387 [Ophiocordyceps polyrhachis-furcata BCC 54312]|uniref:Survival motor neuron Tudor domain-containing protein n=1 Tax=Ophiocordyceps polyrhachis-furcata BCC 54312 TaxID=1330021 RepID=A0A367LCJ3_9HYPO|nr:hypothetical protein L249_0387 [Ophiocordyceps polyrhachis-furcata BCC 54312]
MAEVDEVVWDDSVLVDSWTDALNEYKKYHSIHARGGSIKDLEPENTHKSVCFVPHACRFSLTLQSAPRAPADLMAQLVATKLLQISEKRASVKRMRKKREKSRQRGKHIRLMFVMLLRGKRPEENLTLSRPHLPEATIFHSETIGFIRARPKSQPRLFWDRLKMEILRDYSWLGTTRVTTWGSTKDISKRSSRHCELARRFLKERDEPMFWP